MARQNETRPRGDAGRASEVICSATNASEDIRSPLALQLMFLARRFGALDPALLAAVASLAFSTTEAPQ